MSRENSPRGRMQIPPFPYSEAVNGGHSLSLQNSPVFPHNVADTDPEAVFWALSGLDRHDLPRCGKVKGRSPEASLTNSAGRSLTRSLVGPAN